MNVTKENIFINIFDKKDIIIYNFIIVIKIEESKFVNILS